MLTPVSRIEPSIDLCISPPVVPRSCFNLVKKWIALSTDIPNAMLNTSMVDDFSRMSKNPISAAVTKSGIKLGMIEINTIFHEVKSQTIQSEINRIANARLCTRLSTSLSEPLVNIRLEPVRLVLYFSCGK